jgi:DNA-directed RNA polymerase subunit RPC12/RpoP
MEVGVNEIICPLCRHKDSDYDYAVDEGPMEMEWVCSRCEGEFILQSDIYNIYWELQSMTFEEKETKEREEQKRAELYRKKARGE